MAKVCVQCDKKIGLFKSPVEGIYCSVECRDAAKRDIEENQRLAAERIQAEEAAAREAEAQAAAEAERISIEMTAKSHCPKCGTEWKLELRTDPEGEDKGECGKCGYSAAFTHIEKCPTCRTMSMVISSEGGRCPKCKGRKS